VAYSEPGGGPAAPAVETEGLTQRFGGLVVLEDVSLRVAPGERVAILGPNGAGKTTLFHILGGQLRPTAGRVRLFGEDVTRWPPHRRAARGLGRTFQISNLFAPLTVRENVLLALQALAPRGARFFLRPLLADRALAARADAALDAWGMGALGSTLVANLSYGDQRQLEILLATAGAARLLLLDEPTSGLSAAETQQVRARLASLPPALTLLLIEHDMDVAFALAERVIVLHQGRVLVDDRPEAVRANQQVREIYLGEEPSAVRT
jgi:branched-chain amino acid transport system ATP-binding protein